MGCYLHLIAVQSLRNEASVVVAAEGEVYQVAIVTDMTMVRGIPKVDQCGRGIALEIEPLPMDLEDLMVAEAGTEDPLVTLIAVSMKRGKYKTSSPISPTRAWSTLHRHLQHIDRHLKITITLRHLCHHHRIARQ